MFDFACVAIFEALAVCVARLHLAKQTREHLQHLVEFFALYMRMRFRGFYRRSVVLVPGGSYRRILVTEGIRRQRLELAI